MHDSSWYILTDTIKLVLIAQVLGIAGGTETGVAADPSTRGPTIGDVIPGLNVEPGSYIMPLWGVILLVLAPACIGLSWGVIEILRLHKLPIDGSGVNSSSVATDSGVSTDGDSPLLAESNAVEKSLKMMREVSAHIAEGATAFLVEEYKYLLVYIIVFGIVIGVITSWFAALAFLVGAITSCLSGFIGMRTAVFCNVRTAHECWKSLRLGYDVAIRGGSVMGFSLVSLGVLTIFGLTALLNAVMKLENSGKSYDGPSILFEALAGYGLGASSIALFARVGGGIYTKAADVGADLSGKNEYGMDEDDPRNPACIADNVGDNVGDIAGMGADLFGSFAEATCAAFVLIGNSTLSHLNIYEAPIMYPLLISSSGIFVSWITVLLVPVLMPVKEIACIERSLKSLLFVSTLLMTPAIVGLSYVCLPPEFMVGIRSPLLPQSLKEEDAGKMVEWYACMASVLMGLWSGLLVGLVTEYFTSHSYRPVRDIALSQRTSAATGIIYGLALGYLSTIVPVLALSVTILVSHEFCGMYGIALAALGMLSTLCVGLAIDAYGPIADNAGGIAEMSHLGASVRRRTDALDAAGNTTAAVGKGFAIGSAALVALALFGAFCTRANIEKVNVLNAWTFAGVLYGAMMPYAFSALTMKSVGKAATDMVDECMRQFPKIINGEAPPDYTRCISISTSASLKEMILPGALVILSPLVFGVLCGKNATAGLLVGALSSGVQMAISMSNTGGAWDNAKNPKIPTSAPPSQPSHSAGPSTWRGRGGNSVPVAPKSSAPNPSMNGIGAKGFGKGKGGYDGGKGGWDGKGGYDGGKAGYDGGKGGYDSGKGGYDGGKAGYDGGKGGYDGGKGGYDGGKGAFDGGKGTGYYQEGPSPDDRPDERTGGNAMDITNLLPMFRDDSSHPSGHSSDQQQQQHFQGPPAQEDTAPQPVVSGDSGDDDTAAQGEQQPSMEHLKQEWAMLQHKLEQQRNEGRGMMKAAAAAQDEGLVGGEPSQIQQQQHAAPPPRFEDSYQERRLENNNSGQLLQQQQQQQQPEGYEDTYPDQYPREEAAAPREQPDTRGYQESALPTPPTGPVGMAPPLPQRGYAPPPQHVDDRYMQQPQQQQPYGQLGPQVSHQEPRRTIGYEHMVGTDMSRQQEPAFGHGVGGQQQQQQQARYAGSYQQQQQPQRDMGERMRPVEYDGPPRVNGRLQAAENNAALMRPATRYGAERNGPAVAPRDAEHRIEQDLAPPRREDFAPDPRQSLSQVRYSEPRQQQQQQSYYSSEDYIDPYDPRRAEPSSRGEYYQLDRSDRYEREPMRYASHEDPLCPDSLRRIEYDREYRRSPGVQPRYDTRRQTEESLRWPHAGRTYKDDVQQVRDSRARFIESRPDPWYARPRIGHRQMPKIRFEHDERRMVFVDDANQLVSMPFDLSVEDMYRDITKDSVKHMSREELRALRLRLQQERGRLDKRLEECHNHHGDMVTRMFNLDYTPAVDPHPRLLWGLEAFDREASTAAAHPPLRSSDNRDLISFDRRSVTSSSDGRRFDEAAAPVRTPDRGMLPGPPSPPRALGPPSVDSMSALRSPPVQPVMMQEREFEQWEQAASRGSGRADSVPDGCCPMCHAKFPDEDSLQQHAENCNDQCPERTEGPSRPGVGHPVIVKSSYTPDAGDDNQLPLSVGDEVLLSELDNDGSGWTMVNKDGDLGWVPTAVLDLEPRGRR